MTHFQCAAELYLTARARVHTVVEQNNNANTTSTSTTTHTTESSAAEDHLCLDLMLIETMQSRAAYHVQQHMDKMGLANEQMEQYDKALSCYEKALLARSRFYGKVTWKWLGH